MNSSNLLHSPSLDFCLLKNKAGPPSPQSNDKMQDSYVSENDSLVVLSISSLIVTKHSEAHLMSLCCWNFFVWVFCLISTVAQIVG